MIQAIRKQVKIQSDGLIQIYVPEFKPGTIAEVIVLEPSEKKKKRSLTSIIGKGQGCFGSAEEVDAFIRKERESWE
ncbi:hypothetical protein FTO68_04635 [Methanocalculus taiwanensis]|jgi:hypothetical protein|uniref:AbrB family transcriptional regulator n=1 Tax=Methanocalculus taiwanensis TaxID=106207 RepID=A0ABD4TLW0_9EURY|nr:hypothetical protein [Methanocalculus taiwanensis]MCQ1538275.1 hypothetical protein [Methanocalculus taiwanensis]